MATLLIRSEKLNIAAIPMAYGRTYDFTKKLRKVIFLSHYHFRSILSIFFLNQACSAKSLGNLPNMPLAWIRFLMWSLL